jgi:hypothetical protein
MGEVTNMFYGISTTRASRYGDNNKRRVLDAEALWAGNARTVHRPFATSSLDLRVPVRVFSGGFYPRAIYFFSSKFFPAQKSETATRKGCLPAFFPRFSYCARTFGSAIAWRA